MVSQTELRGALRRFWGYDSFRPLQEEVVSSLIGGHDVCAVMPTGFGKSLCYQLPAAMLSNETVVVVSPLIALMQDQVAQLTQMGIPSALLNSSLSKPRQAQVINEATEGKYRLLYLSPERLAAVDTSQWLRRVPVSFFAIDEAHCISEWGHEFRPEYRQLRRLRAEFPERRIAAFTASATRRVRHDIIEQLGLSDPDKYIHSFYRPNLRYFTIECDEDLQQKMLLSALRYYSGENVIVYAPTIAKVGATIEFLERNKIPALPYHGKMNSSARRLNQERWMADEVRVLVGTIAFGLGINKPAVRAVIHLALPKSIEQYYQEAGRAGRDGLPRRLRFPLAPKRHRAPGVLRGQLRDQEERGARLGPQSPDSRLRPIKNLQASSDMYPLWGNPEVEVLRGLRRLWLVRSHGASRPWMSNGMSSISVPPLCPLPCRDSPGICGNTRFNRPQS